MNTGGPGTTTFPGHRQVRIQQRIACNQLRGRDNFLAVTP
jgi:hypothetical protein